MKHKIIRGEIGFCPRVLCKRQPVIPYGEHADYGICGTRVFCPLCKRLYDPEYPRHKLVDGAYFGPNLIAEMLLTFPGVKSHTPFEQYVPMIYGFKLHKSRV